MELVIRLIWLLASKPYLQTLVVYGITLRENPLLLSGLPTLPSFALVAQIGFLSPYMRKVTWHFVDRRHRSLPRTCRS